MDNKLLNIISESINEFKAKAISDIKPGIRKIESPNNDKIASVSNSSIKNALRTICPKNIENIKHDYPMTANNGWYQYCERAVR